MWAIGLRCKGKSFGPFKLVGGIAKGHPNQEEVKKYKEQLDRSRTQYKILLEETQTDGSIMIEIKKQYNASSVGSYLD